MAWGMQFRMTIKGMWLGSSIYSVAPCAKLPHTYTRQVNTSRLTQGLFATQVTVLKIEQLLGHCATLWLSGSLQQCASVLSGTHRSST